MEIEPQCTTAESVVKEYAIMVYRLAFAQVRSKSDADDIFQEVLRDRPWAYCRTQGTV